MTGAGILDGLRVVEFSQLIAAPLCGLSLADWGAEVIKVETPDGDYTRTLPPRLASGESAYYQMLNRGKRSIALDLRSASAGNVVRRLVDAADVVVESLGEAVRHLGTSPEEARERNPRLVWCSISGLGRAAGGRAIDPTLQAAMGMMALTGQPDGPPTRLPVPLIDFMTGMYAAQSVLAALFAVQRGGDGAVLDCAMLDAAATLASSSGVYALAGDQPLRRMGSQNLWYVPADNFRAADGEWVQVMAISEHHWRVLARALGHPEWIDAPGFRDNDERVANRDAVHRAVGDAIARATAEHWSRVVTAAGGFCQRIVEIEEAWAAPVLADRGLVAPLEDEDGAVSTSIPRVSLARIPGQAPSPYRRAPRLGEHSRAIARELGLDESDVAGLVRDPRPQGG